MSELYTHSPRTRKILWVLAPIVCPPEIVERDLLEPTIDKMESFMQGLPTEIQWATAIGVQAFDMSAALYPANMGKAFSELDADRALKWFELWWHSPVALMREFAKKTKGLLVFSYYEQPKVNAEIAYHPDRWIKAVAARRLKKYGEEIRRKEEEVCQSDPLTPKMIKQTLRHGA